MKLTRTAYSLGVCALAIIAMAAHAAGLYDVAALIAAHPEVAAGLGALAMAGEIHMKDVGPALQEFSRSANQKIDAATKKAEEVEQRQVELQAEIQNLAQHMARGTHALSGPIDPHLALTKSLEESTGFQALRDRNTNRCKIDLPRDFFTKAPLTSTTEGVEALVTADRRPGIVIPGQRRLTIRDLLPSVPTESGSVEYVREVSMTNNAATVAEGALKPQSTVTLELLTAKVVTIAHWAHASNQILADVPYLASYLEGRLRYGLMYVEEMQLLMGAGTGTDLAGLYTLATNYSAPYTPLGDTMIDQSRGAMAQLENSNYRATAFVLHPNDWTRIELLKTSDGAYLKANPNEGNARVLWGLPVVTTTAMTQDKFLVGDFNQAAVIFDRQNPTLDIATQDQDDFVKNLVKLRVEERLALAVQLPGALVKGDFGNIA